MYHRTPKSKDPSLDRRLTLKATLELCTKYTGVEKYDLDPCGEPSNPIAPCAYWRERDENGLDSVWFGNVWVNPPWSDLPTWTKKCWAEWETGQCQSISLLIPVRSEQPFWQEHIEPYRDNGGPLSCYFLPKRQRFGTPEDPLGLKSGSPPFICCLLHWS